MRCILLLFFSASQARLLLSFLSWRRRAFFACAFSSAVSDFDSAFSEFTARRYACLRSVPSRFALNSAPPLASIAAACFRCASASCICRRSSSRSFAAAVDATSFAALDCALAVSAYATSTFLLGL